MHLVKHRAAASLCILLVAIIIVGERFWQLISFWLEVIQHRFERIVEPFWFIECVLAALAVFYLALAARGALRFGSRRSVAVSVSAFALFSIAYIVLIRTRWFLWSALLFV